MMKLALIIVSIVCVCVIAQRECNGPFCENSRPIFFHRVPKLSTTPLTREMCSRYHHYLQPKVCRLLTINETRLQELADRYLCPIRDRYNPTRPPHNGRRKKRSSLENDCTEHSIQNIIYYANQVNWPFLERDVLYFPHPNDTSKSLYQTTFVKPCPGTEQFHYGEQTFVCDEEDLWIRAAVFGNGFNNYDVEVITLKTRGMCALKRVV